ncbi:unnamed protein product [Moneuplotes crassus]|uniref:Uncharacterized protein n=1 Tax=Euplotes crassus TaxID=5936 RepID=A0AAD1UK20_EUPCR|nr:unnamed protein product [Moneuplotes crassus]
MGEKKVFQNNLRVVLEDGTQAKKRDTRNFHIVSHKCSRLNETEIRSFTRKNQLEMKSHRPRRTEMSPLTPDQNIKSLKLIYENSNVKSLGPSPLRKSNHSKKCESEASKKESFSVKSSFMIPKKKLNSKPKCSKFRALKINRKRTTAHF